MPKPNLVRSNQELYDAVVWFDHMMKKDYSGLSAKLQRTVQDTLSHTRAFIAYPNGKGSYLIGTSKIAGHGLRDMARYDRYRKQLSGSDSERVITSFGIGKEQPVWSVAPIFPGTGDVQQAVHDLCDLAGRRPNSAAVVRVMPVPADPAFTRTPVYEVMLAALRKANFTEIERRKLFEEAAA